MLVRTWMSKNVVTVSPNDTMKDATDIMREHGFRHLPVVEQGRLVGIITLSDIRSASPSLATTFSVGEINYLVDQIRVKDIMTRDVVTVSPEATVEDAAILAHKRGISALPVVEHGRLAGIITQSDFYDILMSIFQAGEDDSRITLENMPPKLGSIQRIIDVLDRQGVRFSSILTFPQRDNGNYTYWVRVVRGKVEDVVRDLEDEGLKVAHYS